MNCDAFMNVNYQKLDDIPDDYGRFHCLFRCSDNNGSEPVNVLDAKGEGHYVGCALSMQGENLNYLSYSAIVSV
jgi:hypothetical protein